jgi:hypothetical protein
MATPPGWEPIPDAPPGWESVPTSGSTAAAGPAPDLIGQIKAHLTKEPPAGSYRDNPVARSIRNLGRFAMPGSIPGAIGAAASQITGAGPLYALGRPLLAAGSAAGVEQLRGGDPGQAALEAGGMTAAGEVAGGLARAGSRVVSKVFDPLTKNVAEAIGSLVPVFKGATPRSTLVKAMGTEGQRALSKQYGEAVDNAIAQAGNPVFGMSTVSPKVAELLRAAGRPVPESPVPGYAGPADKIWAQLKSEKNRLLTLARDPARVKDVHLRLDEVHAAEEAFAKAIEARLPPDQRGVFDAANAAYRAGKEIQRLFTGGPSKMTAAKAKQMLSSSGEVSQPDLAANLALRSGKLREALGEEGYAALERAIQRGGELGARDVPGKMPHARIHFLGPVPIPSVYGIPHAPQLVGRPEQVSQIMADIVRRLGVRGSGAAMEQP